MPDQSGPGDRHQQRRVRPAPSDGAGETVVSAGTAAALLLGLVALTGSILALGLVTTAMMTGWLICTDGDADHTGRTDPGPPPRPRPPFGGPSGWF